MRLPRFLFLCGPNTSEKLAFATKLSESNASMMVEDLESPLREAAIALFYDGNILEAASTFKLAAPILNGIVTAGDFLKDLRKFLETEYGPNTLSHIALNNYMFGQFDELFDHILFRDFDSPTQMHPFIEKFGATSCLCILYQPTTYLHSSFPSSATIRVVGNSPEEQLKDFNRCLAMLP